MQPTPADVHSRLETALQAAAAAGAFALDHFRRGVAIESKSDGTPVSLADRGAEQIIRDIISRAFPEDAIFGEEYGETQGRGWSGGAGYRWHIDPIDGTKTFVRGVPLWGTLIGVEHGDQVVAGIAEYPALAERLYASRACGAWHQLADAPPKPAKVSTVETLGESLLCTTSASGFIRRGSWNAYERFVKDCRMVRGWGDCYGWLLVATGRAEVMLETHVRSWDLAPFAVIMEEAGGRFTDWKGEASISSGDAIASNGRVHGAVLDALRGP